jgi:cytochrome c oxidase assembly protein subunit 15
MATATVIAPARNTKPVAWFAWITLSFFLLVVLWGAVVRATGSGGGCGSNWPLCNGDFVPHHPRLATIIEFTHRSTSGICTAMLAALAVFTFRVTPRGHRARKAVLWAVFFLITEALLGAALVLRHWVEDNVSTGRFIAQSIHLTNTLLFMATLALTAFYLLPETHPIEPQRSGRIAAIIAIVTTLAVAATGSLAALADTLSPSSTLAAALAADFNPASPLYIRMRWMHPAATLIGAAAVLWMLRLAGPRNPLARIIAALLALQFALGIADVLLLAPIWMQVLHLLGADLYWIALTLLAAKLLWPEHQLTTDN